MTDLASRIEAAKAQVASLKDQIEKTRTSKKNQTMGGAVRGKGASPPAIRGPPSCKVRRTLKGHFGKVTAMHWAGDSKALISASQDGKLLLWNAVSTNKLRAVSLKSTYVMTVGIEQSKGNLVACGGLDNLCTIYKLDSDAVEPTEMASHNGFLSCCRFLSEEQILTASGDSTIIFWDIASTKPVETFAEHKNDVMSLCIQPKSRQVFVSSSVDRTAKLWDIRKPGGAVMTFSGYHEGDINGIDFMPHDANVFGTASEDGTARVFDIRAHNEITKFGRLMTEGEGFTSVSFSRSGRLLFAGHSDCNVMAFDVLADKAAPAFTLNQAHEQHVSCLGVNPKGDALCTGSWDTTLKIWA